jgi:hypothetical protein
MGRNVVCQALVYVQGHNGGELSPFPPPSSAPVCPVTDAVLESAIFCVKDQILHAFPKLIPMVSRLMPEHQMVNLGFVLSVTVVPELPPLVSLKDFLGKPLAQEDCYAGFAHGQWIMAINR